VGEEADAVFADLADDGLLEPVETETATETTETTTETETEAAIEEEG
jgi:hypothetical protein